MRERVSARRRRIGQPVEIVEAALHIAAEMHRGAPPPSQSNACHTSMSSVEEAVPWSAAPTGTPACPPAASRLRPGSRPTVRRKAAAWPRPRGRRTAPSSAPPPARPRPCGRTAPPRGDRSAPAGHHADKACRPRSRASAPHGDRNTRSALTHSGPSGSSMLLPASFGSLCATTLIKHVSLRRAMRQMPSNANFRPCGARRAAANYPFRRFGFRFSKSDQGAPRPRGSLRSRNHFGRAASGCASRIDHQRDGDARFRHRCGSGRFRRHPPYGCTCEGPSERC